MPKVNRTKTKHEDRGPARQTRIERQVGIVDSTKPSLEAGQIQGSNVYSTVTIDKKVFDNLQDVFPYAVSNYKIDIQDTVSQVWESDPIFKNKLDIVINKYARNYFVSVDPAVLSDIAEQIQIVLDRSARAFSIACVAIRTYNVYNCKDMYGRSLSFLAAHYEDFNDLSDPNHIMFVGEWDFEHTNEIGLNDYTTSTMRRDFVGPLAGLAYISPVLKKTLRGLFAGVIKQADQDNDCARYICMYPEFSQNNVDLDHMHTELSSQATEIRNAISKYPFLTNILEECGCELVQSPDFYDIDQTQNSLEVIYDQENIIRDTLDHFGRTDYALTDDGDVNDMLFAVEDNSFIKTNVLVGPGASMPLFTAIDYATFAVMMMGQINPLCMLVANVSHSDAEDFDKSIYQMPIQRVRLAARSLQSTWTADQCRSSYNIITQWYGKAEEANRIRSNVNVADMDEQWTLYCDNASNPLGTNPENITLDIQYSYSLASYYLPQEFNSTIREISFAAFFLPGIAAASDDTNKQDILA